MCVVFHGMCTNPVLHIPLVMVPRPPALHLLFLHFEFVGCPCWGVHLCWGACPSGGTRPSGGTHPSWGTRPSWGTHPAAAGVGSHLSSETHGGKEMKSQLIAGALRGVKPPKHSSGAGHELGGPREGSVHRISPARWGLAPAVWSPTAAAVSLWGSCSLTKLFNHITS